MQGSRSCAGLSINNLNTWNLAWSGRVVSSQVMSPPSVVWTGPRRDDGGRVLGGVHLEGIQGRAERHEWDATPSGWLPIKSERESPTRKSPKMSWLIVKSVAMPTAHLSNLQTRKSKVGGDAAKRVI